MTWRETLGRLRDELAKERAEMLASRQQYKVALDAEIEEQRKELSRLVTSLGVNQLLNEMNTTLLNGQGDIETDVSWEAAAVDDVEDVEDIDYLEEEEETNLIATILTWEEAGEREIAVDLGLGEDGKNYLEVNGLDTRLESEALEQALVQAFRDELEL